MRKHSPASATRDRLIVQHLPLAYRLARQQWYGIEPLEDLQQVASIGLVKAADCFDAQRGIPFASYAVPKIRGELWRYQRDYPGALRIPRPLQELQGRVRQALQQTCSSAESADIGKLAEHVEDDPQAVMEALRADQMRFPVSLDMPTGPSGTRLGDYLGAWDQEIEALELHETVYALLAALPEAERAVVQLTVMYDLPQRTVARRVGVSQMQVSRLRASGLRRLRRQIAANEALTKSSSFRLSVSAASCRGTRGFPCRWRNAMISKTAWNAESALKTTAKPSTLMIGNAAERYYASVRELLNSLAHRQQDQESFTPGFELPPLDEDMIRFFAPSSIAVHRLSGYGHGGIAGYEHTKISLLDLMGNPGTRTTKSLASLVMVARAIAYHRRTGRRVMLITPSSANKATALRNAVFRAIDLDLVDRDALQITSVVPELSAGKLWSSPLSTEPSLRRRNPVVLYPGREPSGVKALAQRFHQDCEAELRHRFGTDLWYTLDIENYKVADAMRAVAEYEIHPPDPVRGRLHVHAVSSAYGLLGHHLGYRGLLGAPGCAPRYLLVQHLGAPDMVLSLLHGAVRSDLLPDYHHDPVDGLYRQAENPHFPATTFDPAERLDPTFYTRKPPTSAEMNKLIKAAGGGGIVVSLHECLERYAQVRTLLAPGVMLPADPRRLREWSLVMATTGVLNALDRGLVTEDDILIHGSGCYTDDDYQPIPHQYLTTAMEPDDLADIVRGAVSSAQLEIA